MRRALGVLPVQQLNALASSAPLKVGIAEHERQLICNNNEPRRN